MTFLRALMLLALVVWIGGIIFFAFVVAPNLFIRVPSEIVGDVVQRDLTWLHWMGIFSAFVFIFCSLLYSRSRYARVKTFTAVNLLVVIMLALTLISQFRVMPRMQVLRAEFYAGDAAAHQEFTRLHKWSTGLEGGVLILGLMVTFLTARRFS